MSKSIEYYLNLPYKVDIYPEKDGSGYTAVIPDLPGCITSASSIQELWESVAEAKALWLELAIEEGDHVPEPSPIKEEEFSGRFVVRLPRSLHRELAVRANHENTSLNQLVVMLLSDGMARWHESREHYRVSSHLSTKYREVSLREFSNVYSFVINSLGDTTSAPRDFNWSWPVEGWRVRSGDRIKVLG